jgi:membrane-bound lytic murein transglycosylase F
MSLRFTWLLTLLLGACSAPSAPLPLPQHSGVLRVLTLNAAGTYYLNREDAPEGPEHDRVLAFAAAQGWQLSFQVEPSIGALLQALEQGQAHMAAAGLTRLPSRDARLRPGRAYAQTTQQVVCRRGLELPRNAAELAARSVEVAADSSYEETLRALQAQIPQLSYTANEQMGTERLLVRVAEGALDCTVADSQIVTMNQRVLPQLVVAFDLSPPQDLVWYFPPWAGAVATASRRWLRSATGRAELARVDERYYGHLEEFDFVDMRALNRRIEARLPDFLPLFLRAEQRTGLPADLLAAVAYQESNWNPRAVSPTGVRGLMMLTQNTAASLGVKNRLDPQESVEAGARYLAEQHRRLPDEIPEPDRTYMALAAYNVGRGHLLDARSLAERLGRNPDSWAELREVLPLLADERYHRELRYGYARGHEPVHYVQRVRNYRDVIAHVMRGS